MAAKMGLTVRDRLSLVRAAMAGAIDIGRDTVGGKMLGGVLRSGGEPLPRGTADYLAAYSSMPWYRAALSRVSYDVAATGWRLYATSRASRDRRTFYRHQTFQRAGLHERKALRAELKAAGELVEVVDHPLLTLLDTANPFQSGLTARRVTQIHIDAVGESFWLLERGALNQPIAIWPVPPHWVNRTPAPGSMTFGVSFRGWQGDIPASEMIWFCDADPLNPYGRGSGTAQSLGDELETDEFAARMMKALFYNRARPDLVVWPKGETGLQEGEIRRLEEEWTRKNRGFWNAFRPFFLRREVEIKELATDVQALQVVPLREFERDTILQTFGVSPEILGIVKSGAARATITVADQIYAKRVQVPRLELLRAPMQDRLVPLFDERLVLDYVSPDVVDEEMMLKAAEAAPHMLSVDEWRRRMGEGPLDGEAGKVHVMDGKLAQVIFTGKPTEPARPATPTTDRSLPALDHITASRHAKALYEADPDGHTGLLVALWLEPVVAHVLAVPGGEPEEQLHVTLAYCGPVADLGDVAVARALIAVAGAVAGHPALVGRTGGVGRFAASPQSDGRDVLYAVPDVPGLAELRHEVCMALRGAETPPRIDHGWSPHITLAYAEPGAALPAVPVMPLVFRSVSVSVGAQRADLPLQPSPAEMSLRSLPAGGDDPDMVEYARWRRSARKALEAARG